MSFGSLILLKLISRLPVYCVKGIYYIFRVNIFRLIILFIIAYHLNNVLLYKKAEGQ